MSQCPCGSQLSYQQCCEPIHANPTQAQTPEALMRSRYSAHVLGLVDYVVETYHPSCDAASQRQGIEESINSDWLKLEVLSAEPSSHSEEGFVTFKAYFADDGQEYCMQERSRFVRENGQWFYIDGTFPESEQALEPEPKQALLDTPVSSIKVGRNDPCICGSGKKFKKCCG